MTVGSTNSHLPVDFTRSVVRSWERDMGGGEKCIEGELMDIQVR